MLEPVDDDLLEAVERLAELRSARTRRHRRGSICVMPLCSRAFMSLMVAENASGERCGVAVKRQHVVAARRAVAEDENLAPAFGAQVDEVVARAAQKAGEIEVARLERGFVARRA